MGGEKEAAELRKTIQRELEALEHTIYNVERVYLEQTSVHGNLVHGWDLQTYLKNQRHSTIHNVPQPKRVRPVATDRLFSLSSATSEVHRHLREAEADLEEENGHERLRRAKKGLVKTAGRRHSRGHMLDSRDSWKASIEKPANRHRPPLKEAVPRKGTKTQKASLKKLKKKVKKT